jgi:hypothetical protein
VIFEAKGPVGVVGGAGVDGLVAGAPLVAFFFGSWRTQMTFLPFFCRR